MVTASPGFGVREAEAVVGLPEVSGELPDETTAWSAVQGPDAFLARCHAAGQRRPTPLLLHYEVGGYNALHQDLYRPVAFPLQLVVFLSRPGRDCEGGAFLLVEQRARAQSVGEAVVGGEGGGSLHPKEASWSASRSTTRGERWRSAETTHLRC